MYTCWTSPVSNRGSETQLLEGEFIAVYGSEFLYTSLQFKLAVLEYYREKVLYILRVYFRYNRMCISDMSLFLK